MFKKPSMGFLSHKNFKILDAQELQNRFFNHSSLAIDL
jgi:hypothetical protein